MAEEKEYQIRPASAGDIDRLTSLHLKSFQPKDHVPVMLGENYVKATYKWLTSGRDGYALVAEADGRIIGLIGVCDGPYARAMFIACLGQFVWSMAKNPGLLFNPELWNRMFRKRTESNKNRVSVDDYSNYAQITIGAVDSRFRGKGIFPALIEASKVVSKGRNSQTIYVGVYKTNLSVQRSFIKDGWIEEPSLATSDTLFFVANLDREDDNYVAPKYG